MKGFSPRNIKYMRAFAEAWPAAEIVQHAVAQFPRGHNEVPHLRIPMPQSVQAAQPRRLALAVENMPLLDICLVRLPACARSAPSKNKVLLILPPGR